jgi:flagellar basal body-associated protein FliL
MRKTSLLLTLALALSPASAMAAGAAKTDDKSRKLTAAASYLALKGISVSINDPRAFATSITVDVSLDVSDPALHARMSKMGPRLRDVMRTAVSAYVLTHYRRDAPPDLDQLKRMLQASVDRAAGQQGVTVLLANVMIQF